MGILDIFRGSPDERIAKRLMTELRARGEKRQMEYDKAAGLVFTLDENGARSSFRNIANLRYELEHTPAAQHDDVYRRFVSSLVEGTPEAPRDYATVRPRLTLLLKDDSYPAFMHLVNRTELPDGEHLPPISWPVVGDVIGCCVEESDNGFRFIGESDLQTWGITRDQLLADTLASLRARPWEIDSIAGGFLGRSDDSNTSSRLLDETRIRNLPLSGKPVAMVANRDSLWIVGSEDESALLALAQFADKALREGNRHISGRPFVLTDGGWQVFTPPASSAVAFGNLAHLYSQMYWREFKEVLEKYLLQQNQDVFVASLQVYEVPGSEAFVSRVTWTKTVDTIMPVADEVIFVEIDTKAMRVARWADVVRVMETAMIVSSDLPLRYRVNTFPTPEEFAAMGARAP